jgi:phage I-like protein
VKPESLVFASASQTFDGEPAESIVYLPKGEWEITPMVNGKAESVRINVDADSATILQESLASRQNETVRPHAGFDHRPGPASFLPKQFKWDNEKGVILEVDWTESGSKAIKGRDYSYFSPTFLLRDKKVVGLPKDGEIGSLTNNPAFRKIQRIAASADAGFEDKKPMTKVASKLAELQVITAQQAEEGDEDFLTRAIGGLHGELVLSRKANDLLQAENANLQLRVQAVQTSEAEQLIETAIKEGKFPAQDDDTIKFFKEQYLAHPEQTKKVLAALSGNKILGGPIIDVKVKDTKQIGGSQNGADIIEAQKNAIAAIQEVNPGMSFETAFNKARLQHRELFVEA